MATVLKVRRHLGTLSTIVWNYGATFPVATLDSYGTGEMGFSFTAMLPGSDRAKPAEVRLLEVWGTVGPDDFRLTEYAYDFIEHPLVRRRAFHRHDQDHFSESWGSRSMSTARNS